MKIENKTQRLHSGVLHWILSTWFLHFQNDNSRNYLSSLRTLRAGQWGSKGEAVSTLLRFLRLPLRKAPAKSRNDENLLIDKCNRSTFYMEQKNNNDM